MASFVIRNPEGEFFAGYEINRAPGKAPFIPVFVMPTKGNPIAAMVVVSEDLEDVIHDLNNHGIVKFDQVAVA